MDFFLDICPRKYLNLPLSPAPWSVPLFVFPRVPGTLESFCLCLSVQYSVACTCLLVIPSACKPVSHRSLHQLLTSFESAVGSSLSELLSAAMAVSGCIVATVYEQMDLAKHVNYAFAVKFCGNLWQLGRSDNYQCCLIMLTENNLFLSNCILQITVV